MFLLAFKSNFGHGSWNSVRSNPVLRTLTSRFAPDFVGDIFRALTPFLGADPPLKTAAMPVVDAGYQGFSVSTMLPLLVEAAVKWMSIGLPLEIMKIYAFSDDYAIEAKQIFDHCTSAQREELEGSLIESNRSPKEIPLF